MNKRAFATRMTDRLRKTRAGGHGRTRRLLMMVLLAAFAAAAATPVRAHCPVFGPKVYTLGNKPVTFQESFSTSTQQGTFTLIIENGNAAGQRRVTSGSVQLNGVEVVRTNEFGPHVALIQKTVQIQASNALVITLKDGPGKGGSTPPFITLKIIRHINETDGPTITINQPQPGMVASSSPVTVSGTATDISDVTSLAVNGVATPVVNGGFTAQVPLVAGNNTITVTATDCEGNTSTKTVSVALDGQTPFVTITSPANGLLTKAATAQVVGTATDDGTIASVTVNGQPATLAGNSFTFNLSLTEGANPINVIATDATGKQGTASVSVTLDTVAPDLNILTPTAGQIIGQSPTLVSGTVTDSSGVASLTVNGTPTPVVNGGFTAQVPLVAGNNTITVTATDFQGGNTSTRSVQAYFDAQSPTITITSPQDGLLTKVPSLIVTGTVADDNAGSTVTVNGQPAALNGNNFTATVALAEGSNLISVVATDTSGRQTTASVRATLDTTPPAVNLIAPPAGHTAAEPNVTVIGEVSDANGVAAVTVNGQPASVAGGSFELNVPLQLGDNTLVVKATDNAGNERSVPLLVNHFVRLEVSITTPAPQALFREDSVTVTGTADARATAVSVNGVAASLAGGVFTAVNVSLHEGGTLITATARNDSGSVGTATITVLRDSSAPTVHIDSPSDGAMLNTSAVNVTGMVNDVVSGTVNGEQVTVKVNGVSATVTNRSFFVPDLLLVRGLNTLTAVARDTAGNESQMQIRVNVQDAAGQQHLVMVSGNSQTGVIGTTLSAPLLVQAVDANSNPLPGRSLTFTVRRSDGLLRAGAEEGQVVTVQTDANGLASAQFKLGTRLGVGNNDVSVTAPGFTGELIFSHSSTVGAAKEINGAMVMGETARGLVNSPLPMPFQVIITDQGGNPVAGVPVFFTVEQGGGSIGGEPSVTLPTDSDGKAAVFLTLGPQGGVGNNVAKATFQGLLGEPVFFIASGTVPGAATQTRVSGVVLDNAQVPIPNATAKIVGSDLTAFSDAQGQFVIPNAPVGTITLIVDGRTSTRPETFPFLAFQMLTIAGQDNTVGMPIFMPPLDIAGAKTVGGDQDVTLTMKGVPGVAFTVFARSVTDQEGNPYVGPLSISQVHADKVPMPPPNGTVPKLVWTLQPAGLHFNKPIKVQLPNTDGLAPGQVLEIFSFDHALEQFVSGGMARVSADGQVIVSDPGFGIHVSGWGTPAPPPPPKKCVGGCDDDNPCTDDSCEDGACVHRRNIPEGEDCHKVEIDAEVIDQDDPNNTSFGPLNGAVYGGSKPNLSDNLKLKAKTDAGVGVSSYSWSVQGPGSYPPPGSQEEWNVGEIGTTPGMLKFKVVVTFNDGETGEAEKEIDSGIRTDDVTLIGWIDPDNVPLDSSGMDNEMLRYYPTNGAAGMGTIQKGLTTLHLGTLAAAGAVGSDRTIHPVFIRALTPAEKTYILNWMFKFAANFCSRSRCPPTSFGSDQELTTFQTSRRTSYKLFNRFQIKYLTDGSTFKEQPKVLKQAFEIGVTNNPIFDFEEAGAAGPNNGPPKFLSNNAYLINDGTPTGLAVNAFNALAYPLKWNNIGSRIEFSVGFGTGRQVFTQVYPTYFVFDNLMKTRTIPQAPAPIGNFNTNPYPPGPAPYIP